MSGLLVRSDMNSDHDGLRKSSSQHMNVLEKVAAATKVAKCGCSLTLELFMPSEVLEYDRVALDLADRYNSVEIPQNQLIGPFCSMAARAASHGFAVIPCGGADDPSGKRPLIKWGNFKSHPGVDVVAGWAARPAFGAANLGIITGLSGVTVVDCDTPGCLFELYDLFGETPIVVTTPSGGLHLYFRSSGERCGPFRVGDIKGDIRIASREYVPGR